MAATPQWHRLVPDDAVTPGDVVEATVGDVDLVVWRTAAGEACVFAARCPHQWSHLAAEGVVDGDELVCAAHGWRFDTTGRGTKLAMSGRRDEKAAIGVYPCRIADGWMWTAVPAAGEPA